MKEKDFVDKIIDIAYNLCLNLSKVLLLVMVAAISYTVLGRFIMKNPPSWGEEVGILSMIWICFLSAALAVKNSNHIRMTITELIFPKRVSQFLHVLSYIVILLIGLFWIYYGKNVVQISLIAKMPALQISQAWIYAAVPVSGIFLVLMAIGRLKEGNW